MCISAQSIVAQIYLWIQEGILPGLSAKQPKTVAGCVAALKEVIRYAMTLTDHIEYSYMNFIISDGKQSMAITYSGVVPDIFNVGIQVVVEGHYGGVGTFQAQTLLTKCPSKFTAATPTP